LDSGTVDRFKEVEKMLYASSSAQISSITDIKYAKEYKHSYKSLSKTNSDLGDAATECPESNPGSV
jgi:hypothetical protein